MEPSSDAMVPGFAPAGATEVFVTGLRAGDRIWFEGDAKPWKIRARDDRYLICTRPLAAEAEAEHTVIDLDLGIRGTDNYGGLGYTTPREISEAMQRFHERNAGVSRRDNVTLSVDQVELGPDSHPARQEEVPRRSS